MKKFLEVWFALYPIWKLTVKKNYHLNIHNIVQLSPLFIFRREFSLSHFLITVDPELLASIPMTP